MSTDELLARQHEVYLCWYEPHPALDQQGNQIDAKVTLSATVHDCINMQRSRTPSAPDKELLLDFIAHHWAHPVY